MADYQLSGVIKLADQTGAATSSASKNIGNLEGAIGKAKAALTAFGVIEAAKAIVKLGELGAQAERTEQGFETISGGSQRAAANLKAMMDATAGAVDKTTAMGLANQMMQMGLATSAEELGRNAEMATRLGRAMGVDATTAMQNWNAMMANQSIPRLDTFGISSSRVRTRINELMAATEGLTREQAFNQAVMEEGTAAMGRLGDAVEDNALKVEQSKAAWADLKNEIGMAFANAVGNSESGLGRLTRGFADHLAAARDMKDEYGLLRMNVAMFFDTFGANNTIFDQYRTNQEAIAAGIEASAQAYNDVGIGAANAVGPVTDLAAAQVSANEAAANAAIAFYDAAAGLSEMSMWQFAQSQIDALKEAGLKGQELADATHAVLVEFGMLTGAEESTQGALDSLKQSAMEGKISWEAYAMAVASFKSNLDSIPTNKTVTIDVQYNITAPPMPDKGEEPQAFAAGGTSLGGWHWVGERGPELAYLQPGSRVVEHNQSNHIANTFNVYPGSAGAAAYLVNEARRLAAGG